MRAKSSHRGSTPVTGVMARFPLLVYRSLDCRISGGLRCAKVQCPRL